MNIYTTIDYKEYIKSKIAENKDSRGYQTTLSKVIGCSTSFLSQVLSQDIDLTRDQLSYLARFWNLEVEEFEYFLSLLDWSRAKSDELKNYILNKIQELQKKNNNLSVLIGERTISEDEKIVYFYSSWHWAAILAAISIPELRTAESLSQRLSIDIQQVEDILFKLQEFKMAQFVNNEWRTLEKHTHLSQSIFNKLDHVNWRLRIVQELQEPRSSDSLHYRSIFTASRQDIAKIKQMLQDYILQQREIVKTSKEEELCCLTCDFFNL